MALAPHQPLRAVAWILFYGYVGLLIAAGAWGIVGARLDMRWLTGDALHRLDPGAQADLLSQYRFLRALELAFGLFAMRFRREIFTVGIHHRLFLVGMGAGVFARLVSLGADGRPGTPMLVFLAWELLGVCAIAITTHAGRKDDGRWQTVTTTRAAASG